MFADSHYVFLQENLGFLRRICIGAEKESPRARLAMVHSFVIRMCASLAGVIPLWR